MKDKQPALVADLHLHSTFSDGYVPPAEIAQIMAAKGYRFGLTDHAFYRPMDNPAAMRAYLDAVSGLPGPGCARGFEVDFGRPWPWPADVLERTDYLIGSLHSLDLDEGFLHFGPFFNYRAGLAAEYRPTLPLGDGRRFLELCLAAIRHSLARQKVQIFGHCTLLPVVADPGHPDEYLPRWWQEEIIGLAIDSGAAIEISGAWRVPHPEFIQLAVEMGATFSMGSDGHVRRQIGDLEYPLAMVERFGLSPERLYLPPALVASPEKTEAGAEAGAQAKAAAPKESELIWAKPSAS